MIEYGNDIERVGLSLFTAGAGSDDNASLAFGDGDITGPHPGGEIAGDGRRERCGIIAQICGAGETANRVVENVFCGDRNAERHTGSLIADRCEGEVIQGAGIDIEGV